MNSNVLESLVFANKPELEELALLYWAEPARFSDVDRQSVPPEVLLITETTITRFTVEEISRVFACTLGMPYGIDRESKMFADSRPWLPKRMPTAPRTG